MRDSVLSPGVPGDTRPRAPAVLGVFGRAVEVCQAALVEPPARVVVLAAAALHRAVLHGAERIAAVVVHVRGTERSRVLVLLLLVAAERVTYTRKKHFFFLFSVIIVLLQSYYRPRPKQDPVKCLQVRDERETLKKWSGDRGQSLELQH